MTIRRIIPQAMLLALALSFAPAVTRVWRVKLDEKCATIRMRTGELDWVVGIRG